MATTLPLGQFINLPSRDARTTLNQDFGEMGAISASTEKIGLIFHVPKSGTIVGVVFPFGSVTTNDPLVTVALQTVDTTSGSANNPTGTNYGGSLPGTAGSSPYGVADSTLAGSATAVAGDLVAVVIGFNSFNTGDAVVVACGTWTPSFMPCCNRFNGSSWVKKSVTPLMALKYSDGSQVTPILCGVTCRDTTVDIGSGSNPNEYGIKFTTPFETRIVGGRCVATYLSGTAQQAFTVFVYDAVGSVLTSVILNTNTSISDSMFCFTFPTAVVIAADTPYYISIRPISGSANLRLTKKTFLNSAAMIGDYGTGAKGVTRNGEAWTEDATIAYPIQLFLDQIPSGSVSVIEASRSGLQNPYPFRRV
jgi:hypothetical protein